MHKHSKIIHFGAYLELVVGILLGVVLGGGGLMVFVLFPDANNYKKALVGIGLVILGAIVIIITIAIFEALLSLAHANQITDEKGWDESSKDKKGEK